MTFYKLLLHLYPAGFRAEYGEEMAAVFARKRQDSPRFALIAAIADVLWNALLVHLDILRQDLRYTFRSLRAAPGFTFTAVAVAAIGIGATTAAFAMLDHVLLKPLPFAAQDRLMELFEDHSAASGNAGHEWDMAPANYRDWKRMSTSFEMMAAYQHLTFNLVGEGEPRRIAGAALTSEMLPLLGVKPIIGHWFTEDDDAVGAPGTAILSYALWQGAFGGEARVYGKKILLDNVPYTIVGVMPKDFYFPNRIEQIWTTARWEPALYEERDNNFIFGIGRLKPGRTLESAQAELSGVMTQLSRQFPKELKNVGATVHSLRDDIGDQAKVMIEALVGAAACVLLVASMNLANLLIARAMQRNRELALRTALGAGRERLVRQMLTESAALSISGGVIGAVMAAAALPLLVRLVPVYLPIPEIPAVDFRFFGIAFLLTVVTGILFGLIPALRASSLESLSRTGSRDRLRPVLVIAEIMGSVALLICCALLVRAITRIETIDPGFRPAQVLTARMTLPMPKYEKIETRNQFYRGVLAKVEGLPGVESAAFTSFLPMVNRGGLWPVTVPGRLSEVKQNASLRFVTPGFFATMGIPLRSGRDVQFADRTESQYVAVVSESFVKTYWPNGENPIGRVFEFGNNKRIVVGVVGDVRVRGLEKESEPQVYVPYTQAEKVSTFYAPKDLAIRASSSTELASALRQIVHEIDPAQPVADIRTLSDIVEGETMTRRVQAIVLGSFAVIAFLLAGIGIHGLLSFSVTARVREIAVRMALGASNGSIVGAIVRNACAMAAVGVVLGCGIAYWGAMQMTALLAGVKPEDWVSYSAAAFLGIVMALSGALIPALRAIRVDPAIAMRTE